MFGAVMSPVVTADCECESLKRTVEGKQQSRRESDATAGGWQGEGRGDRGEREEVKSNETDRVVVQIRVSPNTHSHSSERSH